MQRPTYRGLTTLLLTLSLLLAGCAGINRTASWYNPLAIPGKSLGAVGFAAADSEWPLVRESGRLLQGMGTLLTAPGLLTEGVVTLDPDKLTGVGEGLVMGTGATLTGTWNLPFFWIPGRNLDLGRDAKVVNEALKHLESFPPDRLGSYKGDKRTFVFPRGTRVRASGQNLIYTVPGYGEIIQAGEANRAWDLLQTICGTRFPAQERSWGFIARSKKRWDKFADVNRVRTILHEFYHQHMQMQAWLKGWTTIYWPAYLACFPFTGWNGHWAEMKGPHAAGIVDQALHSFIPKDAPYRKMILESLQGK